MKTILELRIVGSDDKKHLCVFGRFNGKGAFRNMDVYDITAYTEDGGELRVVRTKRDLLKYGPVDPHKCGGEPAPIADGHIEQEKG